jgi:hypothetical protein
LAQVQIINRVATGGGAQKVSTRVALASWRLEFFKGEGRQELIGANARHLHFIIRYRVCRVP